MSPEVEESGSGERSEGVAGFDVMDMSLAELVVRHDTSVRLQNAMLNFTGRSEVHTIRDYVDAGEVAGAILKRDIRNFGTKTANELDVLVQEAIAGYDPARGRFEREAEREAEVEASALAYRALEQAFGSQTLGEVLANEFLSVRLARALRHSGLSAQTFVSVVDNGQAAETALKGVRGVGRLAVAELRALCERHVSDRILGGEASETDSSDVDESGDGAAQPVADLYVVLSAALDFLSPRELEIVERRHGIEYGRAETLEELGASFGVTRERIRQIEAKAIKRLRIKTGIGVLSTALQAHRERIWEGYGSSYVVFGDIASFRRTLEPYVALALSVIDIGLEQWLDANALRRNHGWFCYSERQAEIVEAAGRLREVAASRPLPCSIGTRGDELEICVAAAKLDLGLHVEAGYLVFRRPGPRLSRAIHLHSLLSRYPEPRSLDRLLADYRTRRPSDRCRERDAAIVMEAAPHLFIKVTDERWSALGRGGDVPSLAGVVADQPFVEDDDRESKIYAAMLDVLRRRGPSRFVDLRDDVAEIIPDTLSAHSIGPMLLMNPDSFLRILPGIYALHDQVPDERVVLEDEIPYLLSEMQARFLAMGRFAGEPWETFVLWTPATEFRLCRWSRFNAPGAVYRSLLAVASIETWPICEDEKDEWRRLSRSEGRYMLQTPVKPIAYKLPYLDRVLAACIQIRHVTGDFNWMAANRVNGRPINSAPGLGLVAVLVAADALVFPESSECPWLRAHPAGPGLEMLLDGLSDELNRTGILSWDGPTGSRLRNTIAERLDGSLGWLDRESMKAMMDGSECVAEVVVDVEDAEVVATEVKRRSDALRREATLQWLLTG